MSGQSWIQSHVRNNRKMQKRQKPRRLRKPGKTGQLQKEGNLKTRKPQAFKNHESAKTRKCKMGKPEVWYGVVDLYGYDSYGELFSIYDLQLCPFLLLRLFCFSRFLGCIVLAGWHFYVLRVCRPNNKGNCQGRDMACPCDVHVMFMSSEVCMLWVSQATGWVKNRMPIASQALAPHLPLSSRGCVAMICHSIKHLIRMDHDGLGV